MPEHTYAPSYNDLAALPRDGATWWRLWDYAARNAETIPDQVFSVGPDRRLTFRDLAEMAERLSAGLAARGVGPGDVVTIRVPNSYEFLALFLACLRIGAVANPLLSNLSVQETAALAVRMDAKLIVVPINYRQQNFIDLLDRIGSHRAKDVVFWRGEVPGHHSVDDLSGDNPPAPFESDPDAMAVIVPTSGTSGAPKGVVHSQRTLIYDAYTAAINALAGDKDVALVPSAFAHIGGVCHANIVPHLLKTRMCYLDSWNARDAAAMIAAEGVTWMAGAGPFLDQLLNSPQVAPEQLATLRSFRCGGSDMSPDLLAAAWARGIEAVRCYGCSECPTVSGVSGDPQDWAIKTDGRVHPHIEMRIVDPDTLMRRALSDTGEIQVRGPELFLGYYEDPEATAETVTPDGWLRTGDIGILDDNNCITVVGRFKDIIIRKGENISAREIEEALVRHPAVECVAVIGLPDPARGEMVAAIVTVAQGRGLDMEEMRRFLETEGVATFKFPERLEVVDALPMTGSGKVKKAELRERYAAD
jgi:acyl-CoA synthetase